MRVELDLHVGWVRRLAPHGRHLAWPFLRRVSFDVQVAVLDPHALAALDPSIVHAFGEVFEQDNLSVLVHDHSFPISWSYLCSKLSSRSAKSLG